VYSDGEKIIAFTLGVVFLVVFFSPETTVSELSGQEVEIVVVSPTLEDHPQYVYLAKLAEHDLNQYCSESGLNTSFRFELFSANRSMAQHYEIVFDKHFEGIDLFVGGGWSSYLFILYSFIEDNGVLIVSPSAKNPQLALDDYIYLLGIQDFDSAEIVAHTSLDYGIDKMLVLERGDSWGEGLGNQFSETYSRLGGETVSRIRYALDSETGILDGLSEAEQVMQEAMLDSPNSTFGVFLLSFSESVDIFQELEQYPTLSSVQWFGHELLVNDMDLAELLFEAPIVEFIAPSPIPFWSEWSLEVASDYYAETGDELGFYEANIYDSCMVLGLSVLEADSVNASLVREEIIGVADDYVGLTGSCGLDENGTRQVYHIGLFEIVSDLNTRWAMVGEYDSSNHDGTWVSR